jgi:ElaB/YqjD/DUF883 family membrane-anchored ribosome-binding protein
VAGHSLCRKENLMRNPAQRERIGDLDRLLLDLERRLAGVTRVIRASRAAPQAVDRVSDTVTVANALNDVAARFRGRARAVGGEAAQLGDDALKIGNDALRKLAHEVQHRPLVTLAIAVGVGVLAAGILSRR